MSRVGFEPTIPVLERAKAVDTLDRVATMIGLLNSTYNFTIYDPFSRK
jgi:hypothetical protein